MLELWKSFACLSSLQGAQHPSTLSDAVYQEPALAGGAREETWGSPHCVPHYQEDLTASSWDMRIVSCPAGPVSEHSERSSALQHLTEAIPSVIPLLPKPPGIWQQLLPVFPRGREEGQLLTVTVTTVTVTIAAVTIPLDTLQCLPVMSNRSVSHLCDLCLKRDPQTQGKHREHYGLSIECLLSSKDKCTRHLVEAHPLGKANSFSRPSKW